MKVAAYTSSLDGKEALWRCIRALEAQSFPLPEIIVVDNRSSDGTQTESFPARVTLLCHLRNLGTSGAVATGFEYALARGYEWLWVLDQDSRPRPDALAKLVQLYERFPPEARTQIGVLSSLVVIDPDEALLYGNLLTPRGPRIVPLSADQVYHECDTTIWSGSLYNLAAVRQVGLPRFGTGGYWEDFSLDMGDIEFGHRIKRAGYRVLVHRASLIDHFIGRVTEGQVLGRKVHTSNHPAFRRYLTFRNMFHFWLYDYPERRLLPVSCFLCGRLVLTLTTILLFEGERWKKSSACLHGAWDGLTRQLYRRF